MKAARGSGKPGWGAKVLWGAVSVVGAGAVGAIALSRNEPINAMWLIVAAVCVYLIGFRFYSRFIALRVMELDNERATPAEREAFLQKIGVIRRFQALDPADRAAVLHGIPQVGMSAEALLFLWGDPYSTAGDARRYAHWYYLGSSFSMAASGNQYRDFGNRVDVYLVKGHVTGWVDYTPATAQD